MSRHSVNTILPGRLYQRGQILTWKREEKVAFFLEHGITMVVNFWPKIDPDLGDAGPGTYLYVPSSSERMLSRDIGAIADLAAAHIRAGRGAVLSLCEAGVTRSVFFAVLVTARTEGLSLPGAFEAVQAAITPRRIRLKDGMDEFIARNGAASTEQPQGSLLDGLPPHCCDPDCDSKAEFAIFGQDSGHPEDVTHACAKHVGGLLGTPQGARENRAWNVVAIEDAR